MTTNSTHLLASLMITSMTVMCWGFHLCCTQYPYTIQTTNSLCWLIDCQPRARTNIRIQGCSCAAYTGIEARICSYLYTDGVVRLAEACQGWSRACQRPPLAFSLLTLDDPATARRQWLNGVQHGVRSWGTEFTGSSVLVARSLHSYTGLRG